MKAGSLFSGIGGLDLAVEALGFDVAWQSEVDPYASKVLAEHWPNVINHGDITAIDWSTVEPVDALVGGFPCQDISFAGRGAGITEGTRSGLWSFYVDAIRVLRPRYVFIENVAALLIRGLDRVLSDLAGLGFDAQWATLRASDVGAPHQRKRLWIIATNSCGQRRQQESKSSLGNEGANGRRTQGDHITSSVSQGRLQAASVTDSDDQRGDRASTHSRWWDESTHSNLAVADSDSERLQRPEHERVGFSLNDINSNNGCKVDWQGYAPAITRWEQVSGQSAPGPTDEKGRLAPEFTEWMMGFPIGWTEAAEKRTQRLKQCGNAVVPQCAIAAFSGLLQRTEEVAA